MSIDASERAELESLRQANQQLHRTVETLQLATSLARVTLWHFDVSGGDVATSRKVDVTTWVVNTLGYESAPTWAASVALMPFGEDRERLTDAAQAYVDGRAPELDTEYRTVHTDGTVHWRFARGYLRRDAGGKPTLLTVASVDVTRIKEAEAEARAAKEQLRDTAMLAGVTLWTFDVEDDDLAHAKSSFVNMTETHGVPAERADDFMSSVLAIVHPEDRGSVGTAFRDYLDARSDRLEFQYRVFGSDNEIHWRLGRGFAKRDTGGRVRVTGTSIDITRIKRAEEAGRAARELLEIGLELAGISMTEIDRGGGRTEAATVSWTAGDVVGNIIPSESLIPLIARRAHEDDWENAHLQIAAAVRGEPTEPFEYRLRGQLPVQWRLGKMILLPNPDGPEKLIAVSLDISKVKQAEEAARLAQQQQRLATDLSGVGVWGYELGDGGDLASAQSVFEPDGVISGLGYGADDIPKTLTARHGATVHPDDRSRMQAMVQDCFAGKLPMLDGECRFIAKDGSIQWRLVRGIVSRDHDGTPRTFMGTAVDINKLKQSEERFRGTFENAAVGMVVAGLHGEILETNTRICDMLGYAHHELIGRAFEDFTLPEEVELDRAQLRRVANGEISTFTRDKRYRKQDESLVWTNLTVCVIERDPGGKPFRLMAIMQDIAERKELELGLHRAREAAETANRSKDEFLANVSHEIRTPMNAVLGMTELALDSATTEHQRQLLATVRSAAKNLLTIINDLLDFSKIAAGKVTLDDAEFSLRATVGDTLRALAVRAHRKGLELLCHINDDVPDALEGDAGRLRQVLMNLVGNAIKFTEQGEVAVDIAAEPAQGSSVALVFAVRDTGIGIARDKQQAIFSAFEQADSSTTRKYGGTGLGLTIAAQLATLMAGEITVLSAPGCGSTFRFTAQFARAAINRDTSVRSVTARPGPTRALRILVAEDNELNVTLLQALLARRGHHAVFARDGRAALELAFSEEPDLMLLDLHMPELDGFEVVAAIRDRERGDPRHLRIIALTARSSARDRERCLAAGMDEFLAKPIEADALWETLDRVIERWPLSPLEPDIVDARAIVRASGGQAEIFEKLRVVLRRTLPIQLAHLQSELARGDFAKLREAAHQLVATVGAFSSSTAQAASALEDAAIRCDLAGCTALVERLGSLCESLIAATERLTFAALAP